MNSRYDKMSKAWRSPQARRRALATMMRALVGAALKVTVEHLLGRQ